MFEILSFQIETKEILYKKIPLDGNSHNSNSIQPSPDAQHRKPLTPPVYLFFRLHRTLHLFTSYLFIKETTHTQSGCIFTHQYLSSWVTRPLFLPLCMLCTNTNKTMYMYVNELRAIKWMAPSINKSWRQHERKHPKKKRKNGK